MYSMSEFTGTIWMEALLWESVHFERFIASVKNISKCTDFLFMHDLALSAFSYFGTSLLRTFYKIYDKKSVHFEGFIPECTNIMKKCQNTKM